MRGSSAPANVYSSKQVFRFLLESRISPCLWNKVFRRELWDGIEFSEGRYYEDVAVLFELILRAKRICMLRDQMVFYRTREDSITQKVTLKNANDYLWATNCLPRFVQSHPERFTAEERTEIRRYSFRRLAKRYCDLYYIDSGASREARNVMKNAMMRYRKIKGELHFRERVALRMVSDCPSGLAWMYRIYQPLCRIRATLREWHRIQSRELTTHFKNTRSDR